MVRRQCLAFSLVEVIVAMGVLLPVMLIAFGILPVYHLANHQAWDVVTASDMARSQLEQLRHTSFDALPASVATTRTEQGIQFTCTATTAPAGTQQPVMLKKATATVTWQTRRAQSLTLECLIVKAASP